MILVTAERVVVGAVADRRTHTYVLPRLRATQTINWLYDNNNSNDNDDDDDDDGKYHTQPMGSDAQLAPPGESKLQQQRQLYEHR